MTCQTFELYLVDYIEGTLSSEHTRDVDAHLQQCQQCRTELVQEQMLSEQIRNLPKFDCPNRVLKSVSAQIAREQQRLSWRERFQAWFATNEHSRKMGATVAAMMIMLVMAVFYRGGENPPVQTIQYTMEELEQAKRDIELTLAYVNFYTQQTGHLVEAQLAATHQAVTQPVQNTLRSQLQSTREAVSRPLEDEMLKPFNSLLKQYESIL